MQLWHAWVWLETVAWTWLLMLTLLVLIDFRLRKRLTG